MTIAVVLKVNDGLVFASDSASTMTSAGADGSSVDVVNIYNNANKIFNLHKGLPIGAITWGLGNIGPASISTLSKELRRRFTGDDPDNLSWALDPAAYEMSDVAERVREFFHDERYQPEIAATTLLGLMVGGYSAGANLPEAYLIQMDGTACPDVHQQLPQEMTGASWFGQPEAITRLMNGVSPNLAAALTNLGVDSTLVPGYVGAIISQLREPIVLPAMPIADVIDLAEFLVDTTIKYVRFTPGHATVGGPVELAAVTRHEGFKWIKRKHYFGQQLNPAL